MNHARFPGCALRLALTNDTAASRGDGASSDCARKAYSREMVMQARRKESFTASAGVGIVGFMGDGLAVVHAFTVSFFGKTNESCRLMTYAKA